MQEFDEKGNLIRGKKKLSEKEKIIHEKNLAYYEGREERKKMREETKNATRRSVKTNN